MYVCVPACVVHGERRAAMHCCCCYYCGVRRRSTIRYLKHRDLIAAAPNTPLASSERTVLQNGIKFISIELCTARRHQSSLVRCVPQTKKFFVSAQNEKKKNNEEFRAKHMRVQAHTFVC